MRSNPWAPGWREHVAKRLRALGYESVMAYLQASPTAPYRVLASRLHADVAPIQLETLAREESVRGGMLARFARDCLVRYLHQNLAQGPGDGHDAEFRIARAFASWSAAMGEHNRSSVDAVWTRLRHDVETGWLPEGADDPTLARAFSDVTFETEAGTK